MPGRDSQTVVLSRQTILLVTAVGVGLLTLCYVLGVQVGKQSAALRHPAAHGAGEDLQDLPASVADQLISLEGVGGPDAGVQKAAPPAGKQLPAKETPAPAPEAKVPAAPRLPAKEPGMPVPAAIAGPRWTLQLISTPDAAEAQRMAAKANSSGFNTSTISEKGLFKVRLAVPGPRETMDATALKLKNRGFKPFAMKVE